MAATVEALPALLESVPPMPFQVFPRTFPEDGFDEMEWVAFDRVRSAITGVLAGRRTELEPSGKVSPGTLILDLMVGGAGEAIFAGIHRHEPGRRPLPGAIPRIVMREGVPSRAWLKMEQALASFGCPDPDGLTVLELGCAPGGASLALLERGARVIGVDPGEIDPVLQRFQDGSDPPFRHLAMAAGGVPMSALPGHVDLLVSDMNLAPPVALRYIERLQRRVRARLLLLTLKINDARMETAIPSFVDRVAKFAPRFKLLATQLPANRREITIFAWEPRKTDG